MLTAKGMRTLAFLLAGTFGATSWQTVMAQISPSAYRALGQPDLRQNTLNRVQGVELNGPAGVAIDRRDGALRLYVADSDNNRVLGWADVASYQLGEPPAVVLGQFTPQRTGPLGIGDAGFAVPTGLAVDPRNGNLYVADTGNNRVLRFPSPFANPGRVEPDAVYGQPNFGERTANSSGVDRGTLNGPLAVAFDAAGNLWIADSGNHRVLRYPVSVLDEVAPSADLIIGQSTFTESARNRGLSAVTSSSLDSPAGLTFDTSGNLYISDFANARVLRFAPPFVMDPAATGVFGQPDFATREVSRDVSRALAGPVGLSVGSDARLYVAVPGQNRVAVFDLAAVPGAAATTVLGQQDLTSTTANAGSAPRAAAHTLSGPVDVEVDASGSVFVADARNNRVLRYSARGRSAEQVWGQPDFMANAVNQVEPGSLFAPQRMLVDYSLAPFALYVADTSNHRVLVWRDAVRFRTGDPADMVIGQPDLWTGAANVDAAPRRASATSLFGPRGLAVDGAGNLYVSDTGNNRVLRYPRPVFQGGRITPDAVFGHSDFTASAAAATGPASLRSPTAVAIGPDGNLFVADAGNNRVLEFPAGGATGTPALRVYGQPNFFSSISHAAVSAQTLNQPQGIAVDNAFNLYVADTSANRVLIFANTRDASTTSHAASVVIGSDRFDAPGAAAASAARFNTPVDVALDSQGRLYVSDFRNNRVLIFPSLIFLPTVNGTATGVVGQRSFTANARNGGSADALAAPEGLSQPIGIFVDRRDTLYVADAGNNRVSHFLKAATFRHAANAQASSLGRGALVNIEGEALADTEASAQPPLSLALAEREVVIDDDTRAPLLSVAPGKIELQLPNSTPTGAPRIAVRVESTGELLAGAAGVPVTTYSPGLFARVLNQDGTENSQASPAGKGTTIRLLGTGQGPVSPSLGDGEGAPDGTVRTIAVPTADGSTCLTRQPSVCVAMGTGFGEIQFSGLAANTVGTWQIDVRVPLSVASGEVPVRAVINGVPSNIIRVWVR